MNFKIGVSTILCFLFVFVSFSWAGPKYPPELEKIIPVYPGAVIHMAMKDSDGISAMLMAKDNSDKIEGYYKKKAESKGWKLEGQMSLGVTNSMHFVKGDSGLTIAIMENQQKACVVTINLSKE